MNTGLVYQDATKLAELIRTKEVSPVEVVQAHLDRIHLANPSINAIVAMADDALDAAKAAEAAVMAGEQLGPLHGVPFTAKDGIDASGVLTQLGSPIFKGRVPDADATSVARMKKAGGILLAKTNLPEFSFWIESDNLLSGRTLNPWNLDRTPGGSSGGESAAIAAGMSPIGTGHGCRHLGSRSGGPYRCHRLQANSWKDPHDRHLAPGSAPLLAYRPNGPLRARHRPRILAPGRT